MNILTKSEKIGLIIFVTCFGLMNYITFGQETKLMIIYSPEFRFTDGIFLSFEMLKNNDPVQKKELLIAEDYIEMDFFKRMLTAGEIKYTDVEGKTGLIRREEIFGFSVDGKLNILYRGRFSGEVLVGRISLFTFGKQKYYVQAKSHNSGTVNTKTGTGEIWAGEDEFLRMRYRGSNTCLLDFSNGEVMKLSHNNLKHLISADTVLLREYQQLPRKLRRKQMFFYIGKFNEKNPLYLPQ